MSEQEWIHPQKLRRQRDEALSILAECLGWMDTVMAGCEADNCVSALPRGYGQLPDSVRTFLARIKSA